MKRACIISTLLLTLTITVAMPHYTYATNPSASASSLERVPTESQLAAKIAEVKAIEDYAEYSTLDPELLPYITDYTEDYLYLFALVNTAETMLANYEQTSPADLDMIMSAANDAIIACNLKFGVVKRSAAIEEKNKPASTPVQTLPIATTTPVVTPQNPTTPTTSSNEPIDPAPIASNQATPESSQSENIAVAPIEVPATSTPAPDDLAKTTSGTLDNHPLAFIIISVAGLGIILALIIGNRQKSYRPGRKA